MTPTHLNCDYGLLAIGLQWHGALNLELQRELVRGTPNLASVSKRHTWMGCGTWSNLQ